MLLVKRESFESNNSKHIHPAWTQFSSFQERLYISLGELLDTFSRGAVN